MSIKPDDVPALLDILRTATAHVTKMAERLEFPWDASIDDPRRLHNMYARNLITCYASKVSDLSSAMLMAIDNSNFLAYALCGRALIETTATLRYYITVEYKPLLDAGPLDAEGIRRLIEIDDRHLRGTRFDWESFLFRNYAKLKQDVVAQLEEKRKKRTWAPPVAQESVIAQQRNVLTCVEKWAQETPEVLIAYNLFCDLVHPNIGSNFLVASTSPEGLFFSRFRGEPVGRAIFAQSLPILLSVSHRPLADLLVMLMGTIWDDAELEGGPTTR